MMRRRDLLLGGVAMTWKQPRLESAVGLLEAAAASGEARSAVLHVSSGATTFTRPFGHAKTADVMFLLASITKPMTAAGVMALVDRKELSLSDPVKKGPRPARRTLSDKRRTEMFPGVAIQAPFARIGTFAIAMVLLLAGCVGAIDDGSSPGSDSTWRAPDGTGPGAGGSAGGSAGRSAGGTGGVPSSSALAYTSGLRRLTSWEYDNTLRDLLGDTSRPSKVILPVDGRTPFDNDFLLQEPSKALVDGLDLLAREAVQRLLADTPRRNAVVGCTPAGAQDAGCFRAFLNRFGRRALRRPLTAEDARRWEAAFLPLAADSGDFYSAVETALHAFLQHGEMIDRVETGTPVPGQSGVFKLGAWEVGARLSYFLWGTTPDEPLLEAAQAGSLETPDGVRAAAARMLKDPRAKDVVQRFHALWLGYEAMASLTSSLLRAAQAETAAAITRVVFDEPQPWQNLLRMPETFVPDTLARHYGLAATGSATPRWVGYAATERRGILSHATFLSNGTKDADTSPTMRGIAVRELLMCEEIPPPPPDVNADEPPPVKDASLCKEDRYKVHAAGGCAACHSLLDPIGFGLENYDALGRYRTVQYWTKDAMNNAVAATATAPGAQRCEIRGAGELAGSGAFKGPAELSDLLLKSPRLGQCLATQLYRFAVGRHELDETDKTFVEGMTKRPTAGGGDFRFDDMMLDFVAAGAFRHRRAEL